MRLPNREEQVADLVTRAICGAGLGERGEQGKAGRLGLRLFVPKVSSNMVSVRLYKFTVVYLASA